MYVCMYVCMYVFMSIYLSIDYIYIYTHIISPNMFRMLLSSCSICFGRAIWVNEWMIANYLAVNSHRPWTCKLSYKDTIDGRWNKTLAVLLSTPAPQNFNVIFGLHAWAIGSVRWTKHQTLNTEEARLKFGGGNFTW